jgi:7-cyano-7-deazaguanine synthase
MALSPNCSNPQFKAKRMTSGDTSKALVVLSGGQDSTTCLYWAIQKFGADNVEAVTFDYGQRHRIELDCAAQITALTEVPHRTLSINTFSELGGTALTDDLVEVPEFVKNGELPITFVPGRNLIFLTFAAAHAYQRGIGNLVTGVAQTDYSGYPDCRESTLKALEKAIQLGMEFDIQIHTPLMFLSKADTVRLAQKCGAMEALAYSHTCYRGEQPPCGNCPACELRAKGFAEAGMSDPLVERFRKVV